MDTLTLAVLSLIRERMTEKADRPFTVAIDGRCASGKTTLAGLLSKELSCPVIHMDHFFLRPEQRTPARLATPGGNIDHERFTEEVLIPLKAGKELTYRPFSCETGCLSDPVHIPSSEIVLIEGSYSHHPDLRDSYDLRILLTVSPEEQMRRILARNGERMAAIFRDRWIPMEENYFAFHRVAEHAHAVFKSS